jgi:serine/threonine-protein kinase
MSKEERIDFIRNNGDPRIAILMAIRNAETAQALSAERSLLAENVVKERIKSFGFRVWSADGETRSGPNAKAADFQIHGEVKVKLLSARLAASGLTITKTVLTSWTVKAVDQASGEEIYLNTILPKGKSWASEDQALAEIGKLVGDEFSKNFFLQHFNFSAQPINLIITGLPDAHSARLVLRELRGVRQVLDAQLVSDTGRFQLQLPEGSAMDIVQDAAKPLNTKLGRSFAPAGRAAGYQRQFSSACAEECEPGSKQFLRRDQRAGVTRQGAAQGRKNLDAATPRAAGRVFARTENSTVSSLDSRMLWPNVIRPWPRSMTSSRRRAISASPANVTKVPLVL